MPNNEIFKMCLAKRIMQTLRDIDEIVKCSFVFFINLVMQNFNCTVYLLKL